MPKTKCVHIVPEYCIITAIQIYHHKECPLYGMIFFLLPPPPPPPTRTVVQSLTHTLLNQHEVITLARHYGKRHYPLLTTLVSIIQDDLQKKNYTSFGELQSALASCDSEGVGFISKDLLRHICRGNELPLSDQLIDGTMMK